MADPFAPPPARLGARAVVAPDVESVDVTLRFDVARREATARAAVTFVMDGPDGEPAIDLRQEVASVRLDGEPLPPDAFAPCDLGGGPDAEMRVLATPLAAGTRHHLELEYRLATPSAAGAEPIGWEDGGVRFDLWMSDLEPGRYLEMWVPAPLCHDRLALTVGVEVAGTDRPHLVATNAAEQEPAANRWTLRYPPRFTSLSPMLVLAPADAVEQRRSSVAVPGRAAPLGVRTLRHLDVDADLGACEADVASWLVHLATRYGPWVHDDEFTAFVWGPGRGMEYDGATTASVAALEHEVFHSWFGRGVKPARASDGWIDEAWTSWATMSRRSTVGRFAEAEIDGAPVVLYPPHPWSRATPRESYDVGARLFAALAAAFGGAPQLRSAMAAWYAANAGGLVTTDGLQAHLQSWSGAEIGGLWARYVHGRG
jgi:hypothetical protein